MKKLCFTLLSLHFSLSPSYSTLLSLSALRWVSLPSRFCSEFVSRDGIINKTKQSYCEAEKSINESSRAVQFTIYSNRHIFQSDMPGAQWHQLTNAYQADENTDEKHFDWTQFFKKMWWPEFERGVLLWTPIHCQPWLVSTCSGSTRDVRKKRRSRLGFIITSVL